MTARCNKVVSLDRLDPWQYLLYTLQIVELRAKLETAGDHVKELKLAQEQQVEMVEAVARQRDMYRVLLAQAGHNIG